MANRKVDKIVIENGEIFFKNFSGKASQFSPAGKRTFCLYVDSVADKLKADGWNVKMTKPRDEDDEPRPYIQVNVKYGDYPPDVILVGSSGTQTHLDESSVNMLDWSYITNADLIVSPYSWQMNGKSGITAYLEKMYVQIEEDPFAGKYGAATQAIKDDDLPF